MSNLNPIIKRVQDAADAQARGEAGAQDVLMREIERLKNEAETPSGVLLRMRTQIFQSAAIRILIELGVIQAIAAKNGSPVTATELAKETKSEETLLNRLVRLTSVVGVVDEVGEQTYASNDTTKLLATEGHINGHCHFFDLAGPICGKLREYMRDHGIHQFPNNAGEKGFLEYALGAPMFDFFENSPEDKKYFDGWMEGRRQGTLGKWHEIYPAAEELTKTFDHSKSDVILVDVGGNRGHDIAALKQAKPDLPGRLVLQDLPVTLDSIDTKPLEEQGIEPMRHDFFTPQPVKGARAYFMRNICHDWSDLRSQQILKPIVDAMTPGYSSLLIDDLVVKDQGASLRHTTLDVAMMFFTTGIERTYKHWVALLNSVGLEIVKVWGEVGGYENIIEAMKKA